MIASESIVGAFNYGTGQSQRTCKESLLYKHVNVSQANYQTSVNGKEIIFRFSRKISSHFFLQKLDKVFLVLLL